MNRRHRVSLEGVELDSLDSRIVIQSISEATGKESRNTVSTGGPWGQRVTARRRDSLDVQIGYGIDIKGNNMQSRETVMEAVNAWAAGGGYLRIGYKGNRRLYVRQVDPAGAGDPANWTSNYTITFRADGIPYWEEDTEYGTCTAAADTSGSERLDVGGNTATAAEAEMTNESGGTVNTADITIGASTMLFTGLGLEDGETLVIDHTAEGLLRIRIRSGNSYRSAMSARTAESDDDFYVEPGERSARFRAEGACSLTARARGRFL